MARTARESRGGICYHVINRANAGHRIFFDDQDFREFMKVIVQASDHVDMPMFGFCIMPNHFHFVVQPNENGDLGRWMQWLLTTHVRRHHRRHETSGRLWQGRYKAFPIAQDEHYLTVLRYVERNPLRAQLVEFAEAWPWSSLHTRTRNCNSITLAESPVPLAPDWAAWVNRAQSEAELDKLRQCVNRGRPYGGYMWVQKTVAELGLQSSLREPGRPKKLIRVR